MSNQHDTQTFIDTIRQIANQEIAKGLVDVEKVTYATVSSINADGTANVTIAGGDETYNNITNKSAEILEVGNGVIIKSKNGNIGNGYISVKMGKTANTGNGGGGGGDTGTGDHNELTNRSASDQHPIGAITGLQTTLTSLSNQDSALSQELTGKQEKLTAGTNITISEDNVISASVSGGGDMLKSTYDTNNNGIVDNAEKLEGKTASELQNYNNLTNKPSLSAVASSGSYTDLSNKPTIPSKTSQLSNDSGYITGYSETDPVYMADKPSIALKSELFSGSYNDLSNKPSIPNKTSDLVNDSGYLTNYTETDPTVPSWAKQSTKPTYTKAEVGLGNVDNVKQYSASNPPPYPVTSVSGRTGAITLAKADVGLGNVDNLQQIPMSQKGAVGGVATLGSDGLVPLSQLPEIGGASGNADSKMLTNVSIPTSIWVANSGDATYPYKAVISDSFVTADTFVQVVFNDTQRQEVCFGNPISSSGAITLPCMWKYTSNFIIPTIFLHNIN